jgi:chloramphenicol-sensitive protein RarD
MTTKPENEGLTGLLYGLAAYGFWGFVAIYFKAVKSVPPLEVLAHRIAWSVAVLAILLTVRLKWPAIRAALRERRTLLFLTGSTTLVAVNWFVFIWAVSHDQVLQASLGYFINPLVNVLLGFIFLGERLRRAEWISVGLATAGVAWLTISVGTLPWISLTLAFTFGFYGLLRKMAHVGALEGLAIETWILLPVSIAYLGWLWHDGTLVFAHRSIRIDLLLAAAGLVTALPLLWFAEAVRRLRLATVGLLQYIAPTLQFLLAVLLFREPFSIERLVAFLFIWTAIVIYSSDNVVRLRRERAARRP